MILWTKHHYYYYYCYYYVSIIFILFYFFKNRTTGSNDTNVSTKVNYPTVLQKSLVFLISRFCFTSRLSLRKNRPGISVEFRVPEGAPSWPTFQLAAGALCLATHWAEEFWLDFDSVRESMNTAQSTSLVLYKIERIPHETINFNFAE